MYENQGEAPPPPSCRRPCPLYYGLYR